MEGSTSKPGMGAKTVLRVKGVRDQAKLHKSAKLASLGGKAWRGELLDTRRGKKRDSALEGKAGDGVERG